MKKLWINQNNLSPEKIAALTELCPFDAFTQNDGLLETTAACKMCGLCVKNGPEGCVEFVEEREEARTATDKSEWNGIAVFADCCEGRLHPVTLELIGKASELAARTSQRVMLLLAGHNVSGYISKLISCGADQVFIYDSPLLKDFLIEPYTDVFEDFILKTKPSSFLIGATNAGRSLAPRVAARFRTGLTADCTSLEIREDTGLVQIRPAFGGNIMAQIITPSHRPQMCTVRYRIFDAPTPDEHREGRVVRMEPPENLREQRVSLLSTTQKETFVDISEAEVIVAVGRGVTDKRGLQLLNGLAELLGARIACTRPMVEAGYFDPRLQIGLSGRTVRPRLIITAGISGAVQFMAGMRGSECIISINNDHKAPIFEVAHYCVVGDLYEILPPMLEMAKRNGKETIEG